MDTSGQGRHATRAWWRGALPVALTIGALLPLHAQIPGEQPADTPEARTEAFAQRIDERIAALEAEAETLAGQVQTLLDELRRLEVERALQAARVEEAEMAASAAQADLDEAAARLEALEAERVAQAPDIAARLVEIYKQGRGGNVRVLLGVSDVRDLGRAARALAAMTTITEQRIEEHRRTVEAMREERATLQAAARERQEALDDAERARTAANRAIAARDALIDDIDAQRDLNAQLTGELQLSASRLDQQLRDMAAGRPVTPLDIPIAPFRGALDWPVEGEVAGAFGEPSDRLGGLPRAGIDIAAPEGATVRAVHPGQVEFSGPFAGFGTLVIVDHGEGAVSLYAYLATAEVEVGDRVEAGAPLGTVGVAPAGPPGLYFELQFDGSSVDPVEWLSSR